jgi:3-oxoacyl-[acyl-carrier protein] reductase
VTELETVLITGSSRGIGAATAMVFAKSNYNVIINYLNSEKEALAIVNKINSFGGRAAAYKADVSKRIEVIEFVKEVFNEFKSIDILVNNAGIAQQKLFTDITENEWDNMMDINVKGMFNCCQAVLPGMISRKRGKIINISSIWGMTGASCEVHYSTAKAAVIGFTKALAKELGPSNIQVNCVAPGIIETNMNKSFGKEDRGELIDSTPLMRFGTPEEIAHAIFYFASGKADFLTGQVLSPNGGFII